MGLSIYVRVRDVYGARNIYPACEKARMFAEIAGTKTLTSDTIQRIKALGYEVLVEQQVINI